MTSGTLPETAVDRHGPDRSGRVAPAPPPRSRFRRLARRAGQGLAVLLVLVLVGSLVQAVGERRDVAAHPAPGEHVELPDGRLLHLQVAGEQHDGPTVVLLGGAGASVAAWGWVVPAVAEHATVVAHDRAGLGWSEADDVGTDAVAVIADLRDALAARGLPGPYVVAGHSLGGHHARAFAAAHPDEVAGVVLIDPSHEQQAEALDMPSDSMGPFFTAARVATRLGLLRIHLPDALVGDVRSLPQPERDQALAQMRSVAYWRALGADMGTLDRVGAQLPTGPGALGRLPLHVLLAAAGGADDAQRRQVEDLLELRSGMVDLSSDAQLTVLPDANHVSIVTDRRHARAVADAVIDMVAAVRSG